MKIISIELQGELLFALHRKGLVDSSVGRGGERGNVPPPEIGKIVVEIWCYLPEVYTFGAEAEIQEIFSKKS